MTDGRGPRTAIFGVIALGHVKVLVDRLAGGEGDNLRRTAALEVRMEQRDLPLAGADAGQLVAAVGTGLGRRHVGPRAPDMPPLDVSFHSRYRPMLTVTPAIGFPSGPITRPSTLAVHCDRSSTSPLSCCPSVGSSTKAP